MPDWVFPSLFVATGLVVWVGLALRNSRRQIAALLEKRPNPRKAEYLALMGSDVSPEASAFLWDTMLFYLQPRLSPHPDDDLKDLPINDDDWSMDWPREFADQHEFAEGDLPDWPKSWPVTVRNYGKWLDLGLKKPA